MRLPLFWLTDYVDPGMEASKLATRLAMTGTEVDRVHTHGVAALDYFVVGRVLSAERHPDADRLTVCNVAIGEGDTAQIVCGAPNVASGQTVAVASPGAVMPDGTKLKRAKLRGVESAGMILAEDEVAIGTDHDGIMVLDDDLVPGTPRSLARFRRVPSGMTAPGDATATVWPDATLGAPQTICAVSPSPIATLQTVRRSASGCCCASSTRPTTK